MSTDLPEPLTPADCDLRGLPYMPLDVIRLIDSDMFAETSGEEFKAAVALWCKSWTQVPAASLPNKDKVLAHLSGNAEKWKRIKEGAMRGWILCSDDRWYHPVVAEKALAALPGREEFNHKRSAEAERKARERDDRKALFELLKCHGVTPDWNVSTKALRAQAAQFLSQDNQEYVTGFGCDMSHGVTVYKGEGEKKGEGELTLKPLNPTTTAQPELHQDAATRGVIPSEATLPAVGQLCIAMRAYGIDAAPGNMLMHKLAADGVTVETVKAACEEAKRSKPDEAIGAKYVIGIIARWAKEAATLNVAGATSPGSASGAKPREDWTWKKSNEGIDRKGREMGMYARGGESYADFAARIQAAIDKRKAAPSGQGAHA